jgi:ABC-type lipoprotein release transport system permease subunit
MNTQRIIPFLTIVSVGVIVSIFGMIVSSGFAPEAYPLCQFVFNILVMFYFLEVIPYFREQNKNTNSQLE